MDNSSHDALMAAARDITCDAMHIGEKLRTARLLALGLIGSSESVFDDLVELTATTLDMPAAVLTFVGADYAFVKASFNGPPIGEEAREIAFCNTAIETPNAPLIVTDARIDQRFCHNPKVVNGMLAFYAGMPIVSQDGVPLGALCVADPKPRFITPGQLDRLKGFARVISSLCQMDRHCIESIDTPK
jgi:GAF domain-containing protein